MLTVDGCGLVHARYCINLMLYIFNGRLTWTAGILLKAMYPLTS